VRLRRAVENGILGGGGGGGGGNWAWKREDKYGNKRKVSLSFSLSLKFHPFLVRLKSKVRPTPPRAFFSSFMRKNTFEEGEVGGLGVGLPNFPANLY
jgi:hypothetical protein